MSAWLNTPAFHTWLPGTLHRPVSYGPGYSLENSAGKVLEGFVHDRFLASLDFEKCFDLLWPKACGAVLRKAGMHEGLARVCEHLWAERKRLCSSQECAIPQGEPFWLSAGQRFVERNNPGYNGPTSILILWKTGASQVKQLKVCCPALHHGRLGATKLG